MTQDLDHCLSFFSLLHYTRNPSIRPSYFPSSNVLLSLKPASKSFLSHRPALPPTPLSLLALSQTSTLSQPSLPSSISSTLLFHRSTFLTLHPPHCLPTHPLVLESVATQQGDSSQQPGSHTQHCQASTHARARTHTNTQIYPTEKNKTHTSILQ